MFPNEAEGFYRSEANDKWDPSVRSLDQHFGGMYFTITLSSARKLEIALSISANYNLISLVCLRGWVFLAFSGQVLLWPLSLVQGLVFSSLLSPSSPECKIDAIRFVMDGSEITMWIRFVKLI